MKRGFLAAGVVCAALWLPGCVGGTFGSAFRETLDESRRLSATGKLSIENTNGRVRVTTWDEPRVRIEAQKSAGSRAALEALRVEIDGEGERVSVRARQRRKGFFFGGGGSVQYDITVPRTARVSVRNVNGRIEVEGLAGSLRASTVNGAVEAEGLSGEVEASSTNGRIQVSMASVGPSGYHRLGTTNGSVHLVLPENASAEIEARTANGRVACDFPLASGALLSHKRLKGRIGAGGPRFELRTVNGSARVARGPSSFVASLASSRQAEATPRP